MRVDTRGETPVSDDDDDDKLAESSAEGAEAEDDAKGEATPSAEPPGIDAADAKRAAREEAKQRAKDEARAKVAAAAKDTGATATATGEGESTALERRDLPKWNRARVKRKAPVGEEQDTFQTSVRQAGRTAVRRAPLLLIAVVLVAGGIGGAIWWRGQSAAKAAEATQILATAAAYQARGRVEPELDTVLGERARPPAQPLAKDAAELRERVDAPLAQLETTAPGSDAAKVAVLVRASQAMRDARFADAEGLFRSFVEKHRGHELHFLAQEGVLLAKEAQGDTEGAIAEADTLIGEEKGAFYRDQALWQKARLLETLGRKDDALTVYRQYVEEYPLTDPSIARAQVIERLRELDPASVPAGLEVEAPGPGIDLQALMQ